MSLRPSLAEIAVNSHSERHSTISALNDNSTLLEWSRYRDQNLAKWVLRLHWHTQTIEWNTQPGALYKLQALVKPISRHRSRILAKGALPLQKILFSSELRNSHENQTAHGWTKLELRFWQRRDSFLPLSSFLWAAATSGGHRLKALVGTRRNHLRKVHLALLHYSTFQVPLKWLFGFLVGVQ